MNNILTLRGNRFAPRKRKVGMGPITIPKNSVVSLAKLKQIHQSLLTVQEFWQDKKIIDGVLITVYYNRIVAKRNRIGGYLLGDRGLVPNETIVGAKFNDEKSKHIVTHYITRKNLSKTIRLSEQVTNLFERSFQNSTLDSAAFKNPNTFDKLDVSHYDFSKTTFKQYLRDSCFIDHFGVEEIAQQDLKSSIVTFFDTNKDIQDVLKGVGIDLSKANMLDETTVLLDERHVELVLANIPYLVSMAVEDFASLSPDDFHTVSNQVDTVIPQPINEPVVGVIDTLFEKEVYFGEWVEYHDLISSDIRKETADYQHGTAVSSLIVDAPNLNPHLADGCGRFQVRHFGVALHSGFNSFAIIKQIKSIVSQNPDIKVWNLSLGSNEEVRENFISAEAATLDEIQFEYDIIFVIAGTNARVDNDRRKKIGAPADSLNSLIVNSVDFDNQPASYSREGVVLSFFVKPDIAYYGGGKGRYLNVCEPFGLGQVSGTSFAAPLVTRKLAYLIYIMGLSREEAKALLVDSAIGWNDIKTFEEMSLIGNGIVPIRIEDILNTPDDEIKFIVSDISEEYESYNYQFPVPIAKGKYPYVAKATLCYFPNCSRNQGVDYTNTELNLVFGRLKKDGIEPINKDRQHFEDAPGYVKEQDARRLFRKWDNIKHIGESFTSRKKPKNIFNEDNPMWGMSVKTIERLQKRDGKGVRFGIVVTLKELNGVNRIDEFVNQASLRGWLVNQLQVENQVELYNKLTEEIEFD